MASIDELPKTPDWALGVALGNYAKIVKFFINGGDFNGCDHMKSISRETNLVLTLSTRQAQAL